MAIEEEISRALRGRAALLLELAHQAMLSANSYDVEGGQPDPWDVSMMRNLLDDSEALGAALCSRSGVSWDSMAGRYGVSRQALHRRLASRGDVLWSRAQRHEDVWSVPERDVLTAELQSALNAWSELVHERAVVLAAELARLRSIPGWWHSL